ncbi:MAG: hypothetical protein H0W44_05260 [Gammaproteobacteria bacterium]|nr:hypothetical protein [Gammaproteobacteria bacterium]
MNKLLLQVVKTGFFLMGTYAVTVLAADSAIQLKNEAFKEIKVNEKGKEVIKLVPPGVALPKDEIFYITTFKNISNKALSDIVITNPIPNNSVYKKDSAVGAGTVIEYSVDGGKRYDKPENLKVKDGDGKLRAATIEDYTDIRWRYTNELKPQQEANVTFRTLVK